MPLDLWAYMLTTIVVLATPGVTISNLSSVALADGIRQAFVVEIGVGIARVSMLICLGLGLTFVVQTVGALYNVIKLVGAAYLIWLGIKHWMGPSSKSNSNPTSSQRRNLLVRGFLVLWSNPKALIFLGALIPNFVDRGAPVAPQLMVLGAIWLSFGLIIDGVYIVLVGWLGRSVRQTASRWTNRIAGGVLIAAGVWLATQQKA